MSQQTLSRPEYLPSEPSLWVVSVWFFGVGDLVTTVVGLQVAGATEVGPVLSQFGRPGIYVAMVALKVAMFGFCYLLWRFVPEPHCKGAPLGLALLGVTVTAWNLVVVSLAVLA